jgi:hypothetical protein
MEFLHRAENIYVKFIRSRFFVFVSSAEENLFGINISKYVYAYLDKK